MIETTAKKRKRSYSKDWETPELLSVVATESTRMQCRERLRAKVQNRNVFNINTLK